MSRVIDRDNLSLEDAQYLHDRGQLTDAEYEAFEGQEVARDQSQEDADIRQRANTGDANTYGETIEDLEKRLELMKAAQAEQGEDFTGFDPDDPNLNLGQATGGSSDFDPDDVDTWSKAQREEVLERHSISVGDSKRSQVRALDSFRRENPDADFSVSAE